MYNKWDGLRTDQQKIALFGAKLRCQVSTNSLEGLLYYCDDQFLILKNKEEYHLINQQFAEISVLEVQDTKLTVSQLAEVDLAQIMDKHLNQAIKEPHELLYDHIQKLYKDCEWQGQDIVIPSLGLKIIAPYRQLKTNMRVFGCYM
ncbi:hypothetical protein pb186bvf_000483 [Paramecium bursaria]